MTQGETERMETMKISSPSEQGRARERRYAKSMGAKAQPASGALRSPRLKGDIKTKLFLFDSKLSTGCRFIVTSAIMHKIRDEALAINKIPALSVEVGGEQFVILRDQDFQAMRKEYER